MQNFLHFHRGFFTMVVLCPITRFSQRMRRILGQKTVSRGEAGQGEGSCLALCLEMSGSRSSRKRGSSNTTTDEFDVSPTKKCREQTLTSTSSGRSNSGGDTSADDVPLNQKFWKLEQEMYRELLELRFTSPVTHTYNPLDYAAQTHQCYLDSYLDSPKRVMFFGMNPGPYGMAQTGVGI